MAKSLIAVRIHYLLKVHYCCKFSITCIAPVKIVVTHKAQLQPDLQNSQMLLPRRNRTNDLWKQERSTMGPNYFFGYIWFFFVDVVFFLTSYLYESLAMGLIKPHMWNGYLTHYDLSGTTASHIAVPYQLMSSSHQPLHKLSKSFLSFLKPSPSYN